MDNTENNNLDNIDIKSMMSNNTNIPNQLTANTNVNKVPYIKGEVKYYKTSIPKINLI